MDSRNSEIAHEVLPYLRVYKDGSVHRLVGTGVVPPDPHNAGVSSTDVVVSEQTGVSARIYRPSAAASSKPFKLPLIVYYHGGAFCISSPADPPYHRSLTAIAAAANAVAVSVGYRKAPEHPLPAAYDDARDSLRWVAAHREEWTREGVDFDRIFLAGDSAGANIAHHMAMRVGDSASRVLGIRGVLMIHPYFWGEDPIGSERDDPGRKAMVDTWWRFVCEEGGCDHPWINPFVDGAPSLELLGCDRVLVCVAEKDILKERGRLYYEKLMASGWRGTAEMVETRGEDHVFHIFDPDSENAVDFFKRLARFVNEIM